MANCFDCIYYIGGTCILNGEKITLPREKEACKCFEECKDLIEKISTEILSNFDEEKPSIDLLESEDIFDILTGKRSSIFYNIVEEDVLFEFINENVKEIKEIIENMGYDDDNWDWEYEL